MGLTLTLAENIVEGVFVKRINRCTVEVKVKNLNFKAYLPNSGRLSELLIPGRKVFLTRRKEKSNLKTSLTLIGVQLKDGVKVSVDSRVPNRLLAQALGQCDLKEFEGFKISSVEPTFRKVRFDFLLKNDSGLNFFVEVKSCTLSKNGAAMFPDAPTIRGKKHVEALIEALNEGNRSAIIFLAQRQDVKIFKPNRETDPAFPETLEEAWRRGVKIYAYKASYDGKTITLLGRIPCKIEKKLLKGDF
jgi:sugar fermentation stimulation protein A